MFYTYIHTKNTTGEVFYVGKGKQDRFICTHNRNKFWHNIVNKHGYKVAEFNCIPDCIKTMEGVSNSNVGRVLKGQRKTHKGFTFKYKNNNSSNNRAKEN